MSMRLQFLSGNLARRLSAFAFCKQTQFPLLLILVFGLFVCPHCPFIQKWPIAPYIFRDPTMAIAFCVAQSGFDEDDFEALAFEARVVAQTFCRQAQRDLSWRSLMGHGREFWLWFLTSAVFDYWEYFKEEAILHNFPTLTGVPLTACKKCELCRSTTRAVAVNDPKLLQLTFQWANGEWAKIDLFSEWILRGSHSLPRPSPLATVHPAWPLWSFCNTTMLMYFNGNR